jgi:hypothetical protein
MGQGWGGVGASGMAARGSSTVPLVRLLLIGVLFLINEWSHIIFLCHEKKFIKKERKDVSSR